MADSDSPERPEPDAVDAAAGDQVSAETDRARTIRELSELITALDRRVPQVERVGEVSIARAAAALRREALRRIDELAGNPPPDGEAHAAVTVRTRGDA